MSSKVVTVPADLPVSELVDLLQEQHVHGAPVIDSDDRLIGFVSQEDVILGSLGRPPVKDGEEVTRLVRHIMTSPAVQGHEESDLQDIALMMWRFRIRHLPIVRDQQVTGIVSALDFTRLFGEGKLIFAPSDHEVKPRKAAPTPGPSPDNA
jgi:CBS domain-containing protein